MQPRPYTISRSSVEGVIIWAARTADQQTLGTLAIRRDTGEIQWVSTLPKFRRNGIATALLSAARADGFSPQHSPHRTPEGEAWARSTGDPLPKNASASASRYAALLMA